MENPPNTVAELRPSDFTELSGDFPQDEASIITGAD